MYDIHPRTQRIADKLGVVIFPSDKPKYKLDIYDGRGLFMFSVGAMGYSDYPTYLETHGKEYADERRRLYMIRHAKGIKNEGSKSWVVWKMLWN